LASPERVSSLFGSALSLNRAHDRSTPTAFGGQ